jgi:hypothetical protein
MTFILKTIIGIISLFLIQIICSYIVSFIIRPFSHPPVSGPMSILYAQRGHFKIDYFILNLLSWPLAIFLVDFVYSQFWSNDILNFWAVIICNLVILWKWDKHRPFWFEFSIAIGMIIGSLIGGVLFLLN